MSTTRRRKNKPIIIKLPNEYYRHEPASRMQPEPASEPNEAGVASSIGQSFGEFKDTMLAGVNDISATVDEGFDGAKRKLNRLMSGENETTSEAFREVQVDDLVFEKRPIMSEPVASLASQGLMQQLSDQLEMVGEFVVDVAATIADTVNELVDGKAVDAGREQVEEVDPPLHFEDRGNAFLKFDFEVNKRFFEKFACLFNSKCETEGLSKKLEFRSDFNRTLDAIYSDCIAVAEKELESYSFDDRAYMRQDVLDTLNKLKAQWQLQLENYWEDRLVFGKKQPEGSRYLEEKKGADSRPSRIKGRRPQRGEKQRAIVEEYLRLFNVFESASIKTLNELSEKLHAGGTYKFKNDNEKVLVEDLFKQALVSEYLPSLTEIQRLCFAANFFAFYETNTDLQQAFIVKQMHELLSRYLKERKDTVQPDKLNDESQSGLQWLVDFGFKKGAMKREIERYKREQGEVKQVSAALEEVVKILNDYLSQVEKQITADCEKAKIEIKARTIADQKRDLKLHYADKLPASIAHRLKKHDEIEAYIELISKEDKSVQKSAKHAYQRLPALAKTISKGSDRKDYVFLNSVIKIINTAVIPALKSWFGIGIQPIAPVAGSAVANQLTGLFGGMAGRKLIEAPASASHANKRSRKQV